MQKNATESFQNGWKQLQLQYTGLVKKEIMEAFSINSRTGFDNRRYGRVTHSKLERECIERIFTKYGVKDIWGF